MAKNFIGADRDQALLMPPSLKEWLPQDHLAWFVVECVSELDLSAFYVRYRDDGWGRAAFEPAMMVAVLLYAYAVGIRSSREIERRLVQDVAFRVIAANNCPDHSTICRFRQLHEAALSELFVSVLGLCVRAGIVDPTSVVIDGSKIAANASGTKNITEDQLEEFAEEVFREAAEVDAAEDERYGDRRGDEMPGHLRERATRLEWIREQLAAQKDADEAYAQRLKERAAKERAMGKKLPGKRPTRPPAKPKRVNTTDPDSRAMKTPSGYIQGFNAQLAVTQDQVIVAADVTSDHTDVRQFAPMVDQAMANLAATGLRAPIGTVVADAGYFSDVNAQLARGPDILIAPVASRQLTSRVEAPAAPPDLTHERRRYEQAIEEIHREVDRRAELMQQVVRADITTKQAAEELGVSTDRVWQLKHVFLRHGRDGLIPRPRRLPKPPTEPSPSPGEVMFAKITTEPGLSTYALRSRSVEPVIGQIKEIDGLRRFPRRGRAACVADFRLQAMAHNVKKLWRAASAPLFSLAFSRT